MRQHILATALAAAVTALAYGQNLNPTVEVTNAYESGASSIAKPAQQMAVPDTVTRFNLDFDYSVFEKPYQGAYEFSPYYVQLKPAPKASTTEKFYLRAGAGFTLHPELDLVFTPVQKDKYRMSIYATHQSYFGRYHDFTLGTVQDGIIPIVQDGKMNGYLADTKAGIDGVYNWDGGLASLDLGFKNRMADNAYRYQKMSGLEAKARVRALPSDDPHFHYDAAIDYSLLGGDLSELQGITADFRESKFSLAGELGPVLEGGSRVLVGMNVDLARYMGDFTGYTGIMAVTPKYQFTLDRWRFSLGARLSWTIYSEDYNVWGESLRHKSGFIYPDVRVDFHLLDDQLVLQAAATGGDRFNTLSGQFFSHPFDYTGRTTHYGHSLERVRAMIGARGNIASRFRYDLQGGYARWTYAPTESLARFVFSYIDPASAASDELHTPILLEQAIMRSFQCEKGFNLLFADFDYGWKSESVTVDGRLSYRHSNVSGSGALAPAAFTGFIRPAYNYGERMKGGLDIAWSTGRKATFGDDYEVMTDAWRIPGWVDLGLFAEYRFTRQFGFWAKGGNLLDQVVHKTPLQAEAGMYFTAGIVLNF